MNAIAYSFLFAWIIVGLTLYRYVLTTWRDPAFWGLVVFSLISLYFSGQQLLSSNVQSITLCAIGTLIGCTTGGLWDLACRLFR